MTATQTVSVKAKGNAVAANGENKDKKKPRRSSILQKMSGRVSASPDISPIKNDKVDQQEP